MLDLFYTIIIAPIVLIIEFVYLFFYKVFQNLTIPLFGVSFTVSFLSLPLYIMAERWQKHEQETIKSFKPAIEKIKSVFKGDEQFMILSTFYRQNHYHPVYALRSSLGIFVQVPFFIAAYSYLSNLELLRGVNFLFIKDLGMPDSLFRLGALPVNILPIAMTVINCVAGAVYTKGLSVRDKIQVYGLAFVFLILLYNSPSGLILYWTLNNIFSLVKNIFYRIKNPLKILYIIGCVVCGLFIIYLLFFMTTRSHNKRLLLTCTVSVFFFLPLILKVLFLFQKNILSKMLQDRRNMTAFFLTSCLTLFLLAGLFIPSSVIASSPMEFCFIDNNASPFTYLFHSTFFYLGMFILWPVFIYFLFPDRIKTFIAPVLAALALFALVYTVLFSGNYGTISNTFKFTTTGVFASPLSTVMLSLCVVPLVVSVIIFILAKIKIPILNYSFSIISIALVVVSVSNIVTINKSYRELSIRKAAGEGKINALEPIFSLSKNDKNVIVIMADNAANGFVPIIFDDLPELYSQFDGFTLYRNTASYSSHTLMGVPPIYGGYDYTPLEMNRRSGVPLVEKHNEALLTLPLLLVDAGFTVTVTDPPWANYTWIPDISIYNAFNGIKAFNIKDSYTGLWYEENGQENNDFTFSKIKRNIIWLSFLKMSLPMTRSIIYDNGWYWNTDSLGDSIVDFINSYAVLESLRELTAFDSDKPSALIISNETAHDSIYLSQPGYKPSSVPDRIGTSRYAENSYYHSSAALYMQLGLWFDFLKENEAYDNTRIIIVADHGSGTAGVISDEPFFSGESKEKYNPVFLVKDFNRHGHLALNNDFMTNADVPALALSELLDNPVNPFTGNPITTKIKDDGIFITTCHIFMANAHGKYRFSIKSNEWLYLKDSIFESSNWERREN
jgi:membrane protein insertase Oxa1/YidC/SpoIIIJ